MNTHNTNDVHASTEAISVNAQITAGTFSVDAQFTVGSGITAFFGPSGAGKSVTLSAIAGLLRPSRGTIALHGHTVADTERNIHVPTQQRNIGMMFQHGALLQHRTPLDNVALAVRTTQSLNRHEKREIAQQWLQRVYAQRLAYANTSSLSGGEQQRVALARALAGSPRTLLLDEPFTALDYTTRQSLRELLKAVVREHNLAAVVVTHDIDDIVHLAQRVVLFNVGATADTIELHGDVEQQISKIIAKRSA